MDIVLKEANKDKQLEKELFYEIGKLLLKHKFQQVKPIYGNSLSIYSYKVKKETIIEELRADIWNRVFTHFDYYENESLELLESCASMHPDNEVELMKYDLEFILIIIEQRLNPEVFSHCKYVQKQIWWCKRSNVNHKSFNKLSTSFKCDLYKFYEALDRQLLRGSRRFELSNRLEHKEYDKEKNIEIEEYVLSNYYGNPRKIYEDYSSLYQLTNAKWSISSLSFDIAVNAIFKKNFKKGLELLDIIFSENNKINYVPGWPFKNFLINKSNAIKIYEVIVKGNYNLKTNVMLSFFERFSVEELYYKFSFDLINWAEKANQNFSISFEHLEKYQNVNSKLFQKILSSLNNKMKEGLKVFFYGSLFENYVGLFKDEQQIIKEAYLIQDFTNNHFDYDSKGLEQLCIYNPDFLLEYFEFYYTIPELKRPNRELRNRYNFIWQNENLEQKVESILDYIIEKENYYGISDHPAGNLFEELKSKESKKAISFLKSYMTKHKSSPEHLTVIMDIVNKKFSNQKESFIKTHLNNNKNIIVFKNVKWIYQQAIWSGNSDPELIRAKRWEEILNYTKSLPEDIMLIPIQNFINETIERNKEYSRKNNRNYN